jgi:hypothetical protein
VRSLFVAFVLEFVGKSRKVTNFEPMRGLKVEVGCKELVLRLDE